MLKIEKKEVPKTQAHHITGSKAQHQRQRPEPMHSSWAAGSAFGVLLHQKCFKLLVLVSEFFGNFPLVLVNVTVLEIKVINQKHPLLPKRKENALRICSLLFLPFPTCRMRFPIKPASSGSDMAFDDLTSAFWIQLLVACFSYKIHASQESLRSTLLKSHLGERV